ncbi:acylneuraminate cytidylyltransferase family protein [Polynucleobacter paneuropaeus]|nr:acylneuraminate cytidylyltransferase family protein [Polynucleobacter paneuropaeus]
MINGKRILAIIPARGGSKRLPSKNIKLLGDRPLIAWTIEFALKQKEIDEVLVSTDSKEIAGVALEFGAQVPWLRPSVYSSDVATSSTVVRHALEELMKLNKYFDYLVLLQPTTPFRESKIFREAILLCESSNGAPVVGFCAAKTHPYWVFKKCGDKAGIEPYFQGATNLTRSQDLPAAYEVSGSIYVMGVSQFLAENTFITKDMKAVFSNDRHYDCDIDDEIDWLFAEALLNKMQHSV